MYDSKEKNRLNGPPLPLSLRYKGTSHENYDQHNVQETENNIWIFRRLCDTGQIFAVKTPCAR